MGYFKISHMSIDVKVPWSKVPLPKTRGHKASTFQIYRLENKLIQGLGDEMCIIISNSV